MKNRLLRRFLAPSMGTLFARYFIAAMITQVVIIIGLGFLVSKFYQGTDSENKRHFMDGTVALLTHELARYPHSTWPAKVEELAHQFIYPVKLVTTLPRELDAESAKQVQDGQTYLDYDRELLYVPLPGDPRYIVMGPLDQPASDDGWVVDDIEILLYWIFSTGLATGLLLYWWLKPLWQDLLSVREASENFAHGTLNARANPAQSKLFSPLSIAFNTMAAHLEKQMETRQVLSHAIAHEIRTPIARLRFGLTMLEEEDNPEELAKYHQGMERDLEELEQLMKASMEYGRLHRGAALLQWETVDLRYWFDDLIELVTPLKPEHIELSLDCCSGNASFDRKLFYVATRNLLFNAFKYAQSKVHMTVEKQPGWLLVHVDDDGSGIPEDDRDKVFEPFFRLDRSRDRATGGYGLGLSFVRLITEYHDGTAVITQSPLGGARFSISIKQSGQV